MKIEFTKSNILVIASLLAVLVIGTYFTASILNNEGSLPPNIFVCAEQKVPFRANITDCNAFPVSPNIEALDGTIANPTAEKVAILFDPNTSGKVGLAAFDIYKVYKSLEPQTNIVPGIAYLYHWPEQPLIPNLTIDSATFQSPVILLRVNQSENKILVDGAKVYVNAKSTDDLDAAACRIGIELIQKTVAC